jgi:tetratricopeptide (TPR) repeat protein
LIYFNAVIYTEYIFVKKEMAKTIQLLSPEKYIKTKARSLPVHECYLTKGWEECGLVNVIVSRRQPSGNFLMGIYLADLKCLGVKETVYKFNVPPFEYKDTINFMASEDNIIPCDYILAHNIVFAAHDYAAEYNIKPDKDFEITRYILDNDEDESVPLMEIPCGDDGVPHLILPEDQVQKYKSALAKLRSYPGEGNFYYTVIDDEGDEVDDDEGYDDEFYIDDYPISDEVFEKFETGEESITDFSLDSIMDLLYRKKFPERNVDIDEVERFYDTLPITNDPVEDLDLMKTPAEKSLQDEIYYMSADDPSQALEASLKAIEQYPDNPIFYNYLHVALIRTGQSEQADIQLKKNFELFPDYPFARLAYSMEIAKAGKAIDAIQLLSIWPTLADIHPGKEIHFSLAKAYYITWALIELERDDIQKGEFYYRLVRIIDSDNIGLETLRSTISYKKNLILFGSDSFDTSKLFNSF